MSPRELWEAKMRRALEDHERLVMEGRRLMDRRMNTVVVVTALVTAVIAFAVLVA